ncbi:glycosyltransferase [uncultured Parabacteroides sp.]|uniref:glycosyltransferase n=1 Tax=uncultured Parabacteroides sp. TaxID=512312 RepID=UPI00258EDA6A|nr:glycosyltransferase [uncultured Parabacteroides sp.]
MKKILFYMTRFPGVGGIERVTFIIIKELLNRGFDIGILSHQSLYVNSEFDSLLCIVQKMPNEKKWCAKENYQFAEQVIEKGNYDIIVYQDSYAPTESIVCSLALKYDIPLYVFEHSSPLFIYNKRNLDSILSFKGFLRRILHPYLLWREKSRKKFLLNNCKRYVLLSKQYIPEFICLLNIDNSDKILYINNPIYSCSENDINKENIILFVGRLTKSKGVYSMINIWKYLSKKLKDWKFIVVGDGEERLYLEELVTKNQIDNIEFVGFQNPLKYYKVAKIFWMMSKFEGWPMTLIESMQLGCIPVAYNSFTSILDILDDQINGFLIHYGDTVSFAEATLKLATDENIRKKMSSSAIAKSYEFNIEKVINKWLFLLKF